MGMAGSIYAFGIWEKNLFGSLDPVKMMGIVIPAVTCLALGFQVIFSSFFLSVLGLKRRWVRSGYLNLTDKQQEMVTFFLKKTRNFRRSLGFDIVKYPPLDNESTHGKRYIHFQKIWIFRGSL